MRHGGRNGRLLISRIALGTGTLAAPTRAAAPAAARPRPRPLPLPLPLVSHSTRVLIRAKDSAAESHARATLSIPRTRAGRRGQLRPRADFPGRGRPGRAVVVAIVVVGAQRTSDWCRKYKRCHTLRFGTRAARARLEVEKWSFSHFRRGTRASMHRKYFQFVSICMFAFHFNIRIFSQILGADLAVVFPDARAISVSPWATPMTAPPRCAMNELVFSAPRIHPFIFISMSSISCVILGPRYCCSG
jgi:hypothetical protein